MGAAEYTIGGECGRCKKLHELCECYERITKLMSEEIKDEDRWKKKKNQPS